MASTDIKNRIAAERDRLTAEEQRERDLTDARAAPLEAGDDKALDKIEQGINESRSLQLRIIERIELLTKRLTEEEQAELSASLDAKEALANKAREIGEKIIRGDYLKQAKALAATLAKLEAIDDFIGDIRNELSGYGRETAIADSNAIRHILPRYWTETVTKRVGLGDPLHPYHGIVFYSGQRAHGANPTLTIPDEHGKTTTFFVDVEVEVQHRDSATWATPLYEECHIPAVEVNESALWTGDSTFLHQTERDRLVEQRLRIQAELGLKEPKA